MNFLKPLAVLSASEPPKPEKTPPNNYTTNYNHIDKLREFAKEFIAVDPNDLSLLLTTAAECLTKSKNKELDNDTRYVNYYRAYYIVTDILPQSKSFHRKKKKAPEFHTLYTSLLGDLTNDVETIKSLESSMLSQHISSQSPVNNYVPPTDTRSEIDLPLPQPSTIESIPLPDHPKLNSIQQPNGMAPLIPQPNTPAPMPPPHTQQISSSSSSSGLYDQIQSSTQLHPPGSNLAPYSLSRSPSPSKPGNSPHRIPRKQVSNNPSPNRSTSSLLDPEFGKPSPPLNLLQTSSSHDSTSPSRSDPSVLEGRLSRIRFNSKSPKQQKSHPLPVPGQSLPFPPSPNNSNQNFATESPKTRPLPIPGTQNNRVAPIPSIISNNIPSQELPLATFDASHNPFAPAPNATTDKASPKELPLLYSTKMSSSASPPSLSLLTLTDSQSSSSLFQRPEFNFPKSFFITPEKLHEFLTGYPDQILVIDIRSRHFFNNGHIPSSNIICFEPIAIRHSLDTTPENLENALIMSPEYEQDLFRNRHTFPLVVYYDANTRSTDFLSGKCLNEQEQKLSIFVDHIFRKAHKKSLKRPPSLLLGGLESWIALYGEKSLWNSVTLSPEYPSYNPNFSNEVDLDNYSMNQFQFPPQTPPMWKNGYDENGGNNQIVAPTPPQTIPSRPYGSRKGSIASPNNRLSFDGSIDLPLPPLPSSVTSPPKSAASSPSISLAAAATLAAQHNNQSPSPHPQYARNTADLFSMSKNCNPQSLQSNFSARGQSTVDMYNVPTRSSRINGPSGQNAMPQVPPRVVHVPQSQSQYPHSGINSGYAMGHAPGSSVPQQNIVQGYNQIRANHNHHPSYGNGGFFPGQGTLQSPATLSYTDLMRSFATGLTNLGNTCYMNCILQCIVATERLSSSFTRAPDLAKINSRLGYKGVLYAAFLRLLTEMINRNNGHVAPVEFRGLCGSICETFKGYRQQDCQEFLNFLLDGLHEELNAAGEKAPLRPLTEAEERIQEKLSLRVASANQWKRYLYSNNSPITTLVQGQYLSRLSCTVCKTTSTTYNAFSSLSLPVPLNRPSCMIEECFRMFTSVEILDGDNAWLCPTCKKRRKTEKHMLISRLPQILIIHLKRFRSNERFGSSKLETNVVYPLQKLDLTEFWVPLSAPEDEGVQQGGQHPPFLYNLYAVATHEGTLQEGHYTSFVNRGKNGWCYFDDATVYKRVAPKHVVNRNAYVLFFERVRPVE